MKSHLVLVTLLAAAGIVCAAVPEPKTLFDIQSAAYAPEKVKSVHSAKLIYEVKTTEGYALFVIRAAAGDRVRLDIIFPKTVSSAGRFGNDFWIYDAKDGFLTVPKRDRENVLYDLAFMPLPFRQTNVFGALKPDGEGVYGNDALKCKCYTVGMTEFPNRTAELWTDAETGKLVLVKSRCAEGNYATSFLQYKDFDGIQLATRINLAGPDNSIRMKLLSADWNLSLPENLFRKSDPREDNTIILLQKTLAANTAVKPAAKPAPAVDQAAQEAARKAAAAKKEAAAQARLQREIERQEKLIRDLQIQIAAKERKLQQLETVFKSDREQAAEAVDSASRSGYNSSWTYYGWRSGSSSGTRAARYAAKSLYKESVKIANAYDNLSRDLTDLQIKLADAKIVLEKLLAAKK